MNRTLKRVAVTADRACRQTPALQSASRRSTIAQFFGSLSTIKILIIGLAILTPIVGVVPVLLFAPSDLAIEYLKWASPLITTGLGYLLGDNVKRNAR